MFDLIQHIYLKHGMRLHPDAYNTQLTVDKTVNTSPTETYNSITKKNWHLETNIAIKILRLLTYEVHQAEFSNPRTIEFKPRFVMKLESTKLSLSSCTCLEYMNSGFPRRSKQHVFIGTIRSSTESEKTRGSSARFDWNHPEGVNPSESLVHISTCL